MSLLLSGSDGLSDVDGTAATPAIRGTDANTGISFGTDTVTISTGGVARVTTDASGNVGIGTSSPASFSGFNTITVNGSTGGIFNTQAAGTNALRIASDTSQGYIFEPRNLPISFSTNNTERMRIDSSGNLLVGTTTAKTSVTVQGQLSTGVTGSASVGAGLYIYANNALTDNSYMTRVSAGNGTTQWFIGNQSITTSSDARLKDNIKPTERNALELLSQWEIVDHTWNDPSDSSQNNRNSRGVWTGVIAQQVQPITPWLVNKPTEDVDPLDNSINPWTMDFGYAVPLLVKAIQEQQALITQLQADVAELKGATP